MPLSSSNKPILPSIEGISEPAALDMLNAMQFVSVECPSSISETSIPTNVVIKSPSNLSKETPIVLIHGFDSSCKFLFLIFEICLYDWCTSCRRSGIQAISS